jgi:hypothetical protein
MEDHKVQLNQDITSFFGEQFYEAKVLAHDMRSKSQVFISEMCNWMDIFIRSF